MRKLILFVHLSLDGYAAGCKGELDWISYDGELQEYAAELVANTGSPIYGRATYQLMESYWPTVLNDPNATGADVAHAQWLEDVTKIVFSTTLKEVTWKNTLLFQSNVAAEIARLKEQPGKDLVVFGSPGFAKTLMQLNLIDEYRLTINPIILGDGKPLFPASLDMTQLRLLQARTFAAGVVALHYQSVRNDV